MRCHERRFVSGVEGAFIGEALPHESAHLHVAGEATYIDDIVEPRGTLHAALGRSAKPHARIVALDLDAVRTAPGVIAVLTAAGIPGVNDCGPVLHDDPILADGLVQYVGQPIFAVAATSLKAARQAALRARVEYAEMPAILTIDDALAAQSFVLPTEHLARGDAARPSPGRRIACAGASVAAARTTSISKGRFRSRCRGKMAACWCTARRSIPREVQMLVAHALAVRAHDVTVECRRMGGAFGGKESQASLFACVAAILARQTGHAVKMRVDRDDDMMMTGKRHAFRYEYEVGFDAAGRIRGLELSLASRCGFSADLSGPVNDRAMFHCDNAYFLENVAITSYRCKTNTVSETAFRGFGGPQGMFAIEYMLEEIAQFLDQGSARRTPRQFLRPGAAQRDPLHDAGRGQRDPGTRRAAGRIIALSRAPRRNRGLEPVEPDAQAWHRADAGEIRHLVHRDALQPGWRAGESVHRRHGAAQSRRHGDGPRAVHEGCPGRGHELGVTLDRVRATATDTAKVPNTSATAASSGSDLNGMAAQAAARTIRERLVAFASKHFGVPATEVRFAANIVRAGSHELSLEAFLQLAYRARISLAASGFYATPKIHYDRKTFSGRPFFYFAYGAAVSEVVIDTLTGENRVLAVDILHDVGASLNPALDRGQIEGGFLQGIGWLTMEQLVWNERGELKTHSPSTYKIPACRDWPERFTSSSSACRIARRRFTAPRLSASRR